ncbi:hypothetical protein B0T18DRAFT_443274 [Schizothecium vesticola]|uniref:MYND-type domain-containing protein n=1 Tax=Schizothecium vesticola TaxID=314040 RepID=A0AA40FC50_9PEZI|nr:hypothetical protein B0T18DRAFT_443274 [Schizothecium vesticola]
MSGTVPRQCAVCGITRHLFPCPHCHGTYHCSDLCLDSDQGLHRPICSLFSALDPRPPSHHLILYFPTNHPRPTPFWMPFGNPTTPSLLSSDSSLPSDIHMRTLLGPGPWHDRAHITQNRLAEEWLLDRELTVYAPIHTSHLPVNRALVAALAEAGHVCDEAEWRGAFVVVAAQRPVASWLAGAGGVPRRPDAGSARAVVDDVTPWDYRQVLNFAVRPTGLGREGMVWVPRWPGGRVVELEAEDAEFGEGDCREALDIEEGYETVGRGDEYTEEGEGVMVEVPSLGLWGGWMVSAEEEEEEK